MLLYSVFLLYIPLPWVCGILAEAYGNLTADHYGIYYGVSVKSRNGVFGKASFKISKTKGKRREKSEENGACNWDGGRARIFAFDHFSVTLYDGARVNQKHPEYDGESSVRI